MKKFLPVLAISLIAVAHAQDSTQIFIKASQSLADVITPKKIYRYPSFSPGKIFFKDGSETAARLNYNFLNGELEFISAEGDTLAIAKQQMLNIRHAMIDTTVFYYHEGYLEQIASNTAGKLVMKRQYRVKRREKIGGYDQPTSTSAIESYGSFSNDGQFNFNLKVRENITLVREPEYYFADRYNTFVRANKKNLLRLFSKQHRQIEDYLKNHPVDFKKEQDLKKLVSFLESASS